MKLQPFDVELHGVFHTMRLYDGRGREVFTVQEAAEVAEELYKAEWQSVFNGSEAMTRDDYLANDA